MATPGQTGSLNPEVIAAWVNRLFAEHPKADGSEYSLQEAADGMTERGFPATRAALSLLRNGERGKRPSFGIIVGLATFFGEDLSGLFPDQPVLSAAEQAELLVLVERLQPESVQLRVLEDVTPEQQRVFLQVLRRIARLEQGDQDPAGNPDPGS
jgi:transcriptional regulator with XRE-family HTH domain